MPALEIAVQPRFEQPKFEYLVEPRMGMAAHEVADLLNRLGDEHWRFIAYDGTSYIFERWIP